MEWVSAMSSSEGMPELYCALAESGTSGQGPSPTGTARLGDDEEMARVARKSDEPDDSFIVEWVNEEVWVEWACDEVEVRKWSRQEILGVCEEDGEVKKSRRGRVLIPPERGLVSLC